MPDSGTQRIEKALHDPGKSRRFHASMGFTIGGTRMRRFREKDPGKGARIGRICYLKTRQVQGDACDSRENLRHIRRSKT